MELGWPPMESKVHGMRLGWCKDWLDDSRMMGTTAQGSETWAAHVFVFFYLFLVILGLRPGQDDFPSILKIKMIILIILVWAEACKQQHMPWHAHTHSHTHFNARFRSSLQLHSAVTLQLAHLRLGPFHKGQSVQRNANGLIETSRGSNALAQMT